MSDSNQKYIDLSHIIEHGLITYKGLPAPVICDFLSRVDSREIYSEGTEFQIGKIEMVANTGTYLDSPFHRYADGADLSELPLSSLADLEGLVIPADAATGAALNPDRLRHLELKGKAVLIRTGWDQYWGTEQYFEGHPFLTEDVAALLVAAGASLVGIDSLNIDDKTDGTRPVHSILLRAGIPIVEHLCRLDALPERGFRFFAVPAKIRAFGTFPVRAFALLQEESTRNS